MKSQQSHTAAWATRFFAIWVGQQISLIGSTLAQFALVWWLTQTTGSATILAIAVAIATLPNIFLGPFVGALVDRWSRRIILIVADGAVAVASALLAVLFWSGAIQIWHVYVILLVRALGTTFHWPAMAATTPLMVPDQHLPRVAGLNQAIGGAVDIIAPPLGALLLGLLALHQIMLIDVVTAALAILPLLFIPVPQPPRLASSDDVKSTIWADMGAGFHYVWG
jgi:DHA3 family macrolide efflux protein-like MFS transporter